MTGVKPIGFAPVFIFTIFTTQFRKLKSEDYQMKFTMNQSRLRIVEASTKPTLLDKPKLIAFPDVICSQAYPPIRMDRECQN
jgi:hypothetical protein